MLVKRDRKAEVKILDIGEPILNLVSLYGCNSFYALAKLVVRRTPLCSKFGLLQFNIYVYSLR